MTSRESDAERIFLEAMEHRGSGEQESFVVGQCAGDPLLLQRVKILLQAFDESNCLLDATGSVATLLMASGAEHPGTQIGPYKLLEQIGSGGMGSVYLAEQKEPVRRKVALKLIKAGMDTKQVVARFEAERQALAMMNHPSIARVLDAGATAAGRPYFVMELVMGSPITEYCDQQKLDTRERLQLFILVCAAVQHAHQKGLIHRDIKPGNVLVELHDVKPVPKVIDFGVAKAIGQSLTEMTLHTGFGQLVGTPLYMSPEQAGQSSIDVDTRSDIYSLGVMLYEVLTGHTPFESAAFRSAGFDEMRRMIREVDPPRPSARVSTLEAKALSTVSDRRRLEPRKLSQQLRGELDWIVMKALEKDRTRRYESASAFAADVQRYLNDEPVEACPPTAGYRLRKFARRNRPLLVTVGLVAAALFTGTGVSVWQAIEANRARQRVDDSLARETEVRNQAEESFRIARQALEATTNRIADDPRLKEQNALKLRKDLLAIAVPFYEQLGSQKSDDRFLKAERATTFGRLAILRRHMGEMDAAQADFERMSTVFAELHHAFPDEPEYGDQLSLSHYERGAMFATVGNLNAAELQFRAARNIADEEITHPPKAAQKRVRAIICSGLGQLLRSTGREQESEREYETGIKLWRELCSDPEADQDDRSGLAQALNSVGVLHAMQNRNAEAGQDLEAARDEYQQLIADRPADPGFRIGLSNCLGNLGITFQAQNRTTEAIAIYRESNEIFKSLVQEFPDVPQYQIQLAGGYCNTGNLLAAGDEPFSSLECFDNAVAVLKPVLAKDARNSTAREFLANSLGSKAQALSGLKRFDEAMLAVDQAIEFVDDRRRADFRLIKYGILSHTDPQRARNEVEQLLLQEHDEKSVLYNTACFYGQLAGRETDAAQSEPCAIRSLELLRKAHREGYFSHPQSLAQFGQDPDFAPLRTRDDFREFEQELTRPQETSSAPAADAGVNSGGIP